MEQNEEDQKIQYRSLWQLIKMVCFYNLGSLYFGYSYVYFSAVPFQIIQQQFSLPFSKQISQGIVYGSIPFGATMGGVLAEAILGKVSRKMTFTIFNSLAVVSAIFIFTKNAYCLIIGRILQGLCVGAYPGLVALMTKQICPVSLQMKMGAIQVVFINFGLFSSFTLSYFLAKVMNPQKYLNITFLVPALLVIFQQILFFISFNHQTPKYQLLRGSVDQAKIIISKIYKEEQLLKDLDLQQQFVQGSQKILPPDNWKAIFVCVCLALSHQLSGIGIILLYSVELAQGFNMEDPLLFSVLLCCVKVISSVILNFTFRKFDQKPTTLIGVLIISISLLVFIVGLQNKNYLQSSSTIILCTALFSHAFGFILAFSAMYSYFALVLQPNKITLMVSLNELTNAIMSSVFPQLRKQSGNPDSPLVFLAMLGFMICSLILLSIFMIRTKNKTELQIREEYNQLRIC